jgi:hypothetical protein
MPYVEKEREMCDVPSHISYRLIYATFPTESIIYSCSTLFYFATSPETMTEELHLSESLCNL